MARDQQKYYDEIADGLGSYLKMMKRDLILRHLTRAQYKKDCTRVKKDIKKLRAGDADEVLDMKRFKAYINQL